MLKKTILTVFLFFIFASCAYAREMPDIIVTAPQAVDLLKKNPDTIIVDVRTPAEFAKGHLANAVNIDFFGGRFDYDILKLPKDKDILLYCRSGKRSLGAAEILKDAGYEKLHDLAGGIQEWQKAGLPVEKADQPPK